MKRAMIILVLLTSFAATAMAGERVEVSLHTKVYLESRFIALGEVALVECDDAELLKKAEAVTLGRVPRTATAKVIKAERIRERLLLAGIPSGEYSVLGAKVEVFNGEQATDGTSVLFAKKADSSTSVAKTPAKVEEKKPAAKKAPVVKRKPVAPAITTLKDIINDAEKEIILAVAASSEIPEDRIVLSNGSQNQWLRRLPEGNIHLSYVKRTQKRGGSNFGRISYALTIEANGKVEDKYTYTVDVQHKLSVVVAVRDVQAKERFTTESLKMEERLFKTKVVGNYSTDITKLLNEAPKRLVRAGSIVDKTKTEPALIVIMGDRVQLIGAGNVKLMKKLFAGSYATAKASGSLGDLIFVEFETNTMVGENKKGFRKGKKMVKRLVKVIGPNLVQAQASNKK